MNPIKAYKLWRAANKGMEEGKRMADKSMKASITVWGAIVTQIPSLMETIGLFLQHKIPLTDFVSAVAVPVGIIIAAIGARRAVGKVIAANGEKQGCQTK